MRQVQSRIFYSRISVRDKLRSREPTFVSATDIVLDSRQKDFAATGLRVPSVLRLHRLVTLTSALIRRELGQLPPDLQRDVDRKLAALFGLKAS